MSTVCLAAMALLGACSKKPAMNPMMAMMMAPPAVRAVKAVSADVPLNVAAVGTVEAVSMVDMKSRVTGQVLRVLFSEGQNVVRDQVLFEIDPEPLQRQIAQLQADLAKDEALEQQARANVVKDEAELKRTQAAADRGLALSKEGIFSKEQTEQVVTTATSAQAALDADRAAVESAMASIKSDRAKLAQTQLQLSYTSVRAPISGRAGAIAMKAGNVVKENDTTLVTLLQMSPVYVGFSIPENLLGDVRRYQAGSPLTVYASSAETSGGSASGRLKFIDNTVDNTTGTIRLKAEFPNRDLALWPGEFVNVRAQLTVERGRTVLPSRTVQTGPRGKYVWVLDAGAQTVAMRPVQVLRIMNMDKAEETAVVGDGLKAGESVISEGQLRLAPGMKVQVLPPATPQTHT